ncbi:MAG: hypothetical protein K0U47_05545 [Epsilonproteobacteria bacterium]|nr:hypothetical protein [Campylobacterota bacterium]
MNGGLNFTFAPPSRLVTTFFSVGALYYLIAALMFWDVDFLKVHYLEPKAVGFIHLFLLGFVMSVIFGAMYQLISVILEIPLYSNDLAYTHLALFVVGIVPFFSAFFIDDLFAYLGYGSMILYLSFLLYVLNIFLSLKKVKKFEIKAYFILAIHTILFLGVSYGLLASLGLVHGEIAFDTVSLAHTHIVLVLFGFTGGLIAIIATVLLPMFMLSHNFNKKISNYLLMGIIAASVMALFKWYEISQMFMIASIFLLVYQLYDIFTKRMRKHLDIYALDMLTSGGFLLLAAFLIPFLQEAMINKLFMIFLLLGFISSFVVGHIYKIVPFLVWNEKFAPLVGEQKVPMLADMVHQRGSQIEYGAKIAALLFLTFGVLAESSMLITIGKVLFILNALLVVANVIYIFKYKG